jgi:transcriptional regulator with XRE-family HTH domain
MTTNVKLPGHVETVGDAVRFLREKQGLTLRALAKAVGVSAPFLSDLEHNRRRTDKIDKFAEELGIEETVLRRFDSRVEPELKEWLESNPEVVELLRDARASGRSPVELRSALRSRKRK